MEDEEEFKICKDCGQIKEITRFSPQKTYRDGRESVCRQCRNLNRKKYNEHYQKAYRDKNYPRGTKVCTKCEKAKELKHFCKQRKYPDGLSLYCRGCAKKMNVPYLPEYTVKKKDMEELIEQGIEPEKPKKKFFFSL